MRDDRCAEINASVTFQDKIEARVVRGNESWNFVYIALGFATAIEGTIIQMCSPVVFPWNICLYGSAVVITGYAFLTNGRLQNWLIATKQEYERKER